MSKEIKDIPVKIIDKPDTPVKTAKLVKSVLAKHVFGKHLSAKHVPAVHDLMTFKVLMDNLRRNHIENIAYPWDRSSFEPVIPVRKAPLAISTSRRRKFPSTS